MRKAQEKFGRKLVVLLFLCACAGYSLVSCSKTEEKIENSVPSVTVAPTEKPMVEIDPNADFSEFKHLNPQHERMPCSICHVRHDNSPKPVFAGHIPCASCHVEQFADKTNGICSICHTDVESGDLKRFPPLRNFSAQFDHGKHLRQANCADCHRPTRSGIALSIPSKSNAHAACFQCHKPETQIGEKFIGACDTCHLSGAPPRAVSESARAFSLSFSHAKHKINCNECHKIQAGRSRGNQVTAPFAAMHDASKSALNCATCHNNKRAFGGDDFSDCKRCHVGPNFQLPGTR